MIARRVTPENHAQLFAAASGKSKQEVAELLARLFPEPDVAPRVRKLPTTSPLPVHVTTVVECGRGRHAFERRS
jgi:hypothetical protein